MFWRRILDNYSFVLICYIYKGVPKKDKQRGYNSHLVPKSVQELDILQIQEIHNFL